MSEFLEKQAILTPKVGFLVEKWTWLPIFRPYFSAISEPKWTVLVPLERELATNSKRIIIFHIEMY